MSAELLYSKDHEWVRVESDGVAVIGVTDFAAEQLGDVVYVDLPEAGSEITSGTEMGEIESTKSVSDLFSPISGTVSETNQAVVDEPELVNSSPFEEGWLIKASFEALPDDLLSAEEYKALTQS
ncbi:MULTISPECIES: glycine cleavage system protein GcvH [Brachybacterium]|uniref:Glycine cleavage system H protein n=2 Tax=Brachybacterium TaxID=43668 RepID=A0A3R8X817_9MICO|nr:MULTISPECIES: glycine cleavage system protein GcvH [Brachybacterium]MCT1437822.1 glycine cleavage system protein GcvH [Brachybacterium paraconglomeratum]RRR19937.1 glycine cleavage system protein GcvH [Brachybacterium paraconglomeratum]GLI31777.1 glycine cleavage system H protein [Brachybacterium conglomeratum]GLK03310.1 glycine cleavage system H protein [Brachybacterium conglomeratum]